MNAPPLSRILEAHSGWVLGVHASEDGSQVVSCSADKTLWVWSSSIEAKCGYVARHILQVTAPSALSLQGL